MKLSQLKTLAARQEKELLETKRLIEQLSANTEKNYSSFAEDRPYAFNAEGLSPSELINECTTSLNRHGFTVIENIIPAEKVAPIREEIESAEIKIERNLSAIKELESTGNSTINPEIQLRPVRRKGYPMKAPNDIIWMPQFAKQLANPLVTSLARRILDDHLRIAQLHLRIIDPDQENQPGGHGLIDIRGANTRGWHADWPHDLSAYGGNDPLKNAGCIRQPFPDVAMCLVMIWYLTDVDSESGGTWAVPGSHKDHRNPRGPQDNINPIAPIPGEIQITAPAGSVFIQDSRSWHSSPKHNNRHRRVAVVNRWCPWWLAVDDFAPGETYNTNMICRPLSLEEYRSLPTALQPLMRHLCPDEKDTLQQPVLDRSQAAANIDKEGIHQRKEDPESLGKSNSHIKVNPS